MVDGRVSEQLPNGKHRRLGEASIKGKTETFFSLVFRLLEISKSIRDWSVIKDLDIWKD